MRTAADATAREVVAAALLRAYYDGRRDAALSRLGRPPRGLDNPPDDEAIVQLLWERADAEMDEMRRRAMEVADAVVQETERGTER
jgi:hypothetical protein